MRVWPSHLPVHLLLVALLASFAVGCASYSDNVRSTQMALARGKPQTALTHINKKLEAKSAQEVPKSLEDDKILYLLERATLLQALGNYDLASRDMMMVDEQLEVLDIGASDAEALAKYMYSDDATTYQAPAYERLMLNAINMINFMAAGDFQGAKIEARRFDVMENFYLKGNGDKEILLPDILALGNYLAGVAFESTGDYETAARYYSRAWYFGMRDVNFQERLVDLFAMTAFKPREVQAMNKDALAGIVAKSKTVEPLSVADYRAKHIQGDTLVVVQSGIAPYKKAVRMPVAQAVTFSQSSRYDRHRISDDNAAQAAQLAAAGTIESVNFPVLSTEGLPPKRTVSVTVGGQPVQITRTFDIGDQVATGWGEIAPALITAAITRMITRAIAGGATQAATKAAGGDSALGFLAGLAVEGAMNAADTPDTRSWTTLPSDVHLMRLKLEPGATQNIEARVDGRPDARQAKIYENSVNVVNFSKIR